MNLLNWLTKKAPDEATEAPNITPPNAFKPRPAPEQDEDHADEYVQPDERGAIELEEVFCLIDYRDADGHETRRRVTTRKVAKGPHAPILTAICHERRAVRHFRTDRIECFISKEGEVIEPADFFREMFAVDLGTIETDPNDQQLILARRIRDVLRPPLSVMVLCAKSDGEFHPNELDTIEAYAEAEIIALEDRFPEFADARVEALDHLNTLIKSLRPQKTSIITYAGMIANYDSERASRFMKSLEKLISADGVISPDEAAFLDDFKVAKGEYFKRMHETWSAMQ